MLGSGRDGTGTDGSQGAGGGSDRNERPGKRRAPAAVILALAALTCLGLADRGRASVTDEPADRRGFFLSLTGQSLEPKGDFTGGLTLWHFDKAFAVPDLGRSFGVGAALGFRREGGLWELNIEHASPTGVINGAAHATGLTTFELNGWGLPWKHIAFQPYYLLGLSVPLLTVTDGARLGGTITDASYTGFGVNVGAGVLANLGRRLFVSVGAKYRFMWFFYVNGEGRGRDITHLTVGLDGPRWGKWLYAPSLGLNLSLGVLL